jgi:hypothetical protein
MAEEEWTIMTGCRKMTKGDASSDPITLFLVLGGPAFSDSKKAEALANSL